MIYYPKWIILYCIYCSMETELVAGLKTNWEVIRAARNKVPPADAAVRPEVLTTKSVLTPEQLIPDRRPDAQPSSPSINF